MSKIKLKFGAPKVLEIITFELEGKEVILTPCTTTLHPGGRARQVNVMLEVNGKMEPATIEVNELDISDETLIKYGYVRPISSGFPNKLRVTVQGQRPLRSESELLRVIGDNITEDEGDVIIVGRGTGKRLPANIVDALRDAGYDVK